MTTKASVDSAVLISSLRDRLFKAAAEIDAGDDTLSDCKGSASPYEQMYDLYGVSNKRPRRDRSPGDSR